MLFRSVAAKSFAWYGLNSFSNFTGAGNSSPLPIQLLSFNAIKNNQQVDCKWSTAIEFNNDYFTIERSDDALTFYPIGIVDGAGTSNMILNYQFSDINPLNGINYYRLRQTDFDGHSTWSEIESVNMNEVKDVELLNAFFSDGNLNFHFNRPVDLLTVKLFDLLGREVYKYDFQNKNILQDYVAVGEIAAGNYLLVVQTQNGEFVSKLFK